MKRYKVVGLVILLALGMGSVIAANLGHKKFVATYYKLLNDATCYGPVECGTTTTQPTCIAGAIGYYTESSCTTVSANTHKLP